VSAGFQQIARALAPPPDAAIVAERVARRLQTDTPIGALETALVVVGLAPVVEEWLFRGVVQQGLVAHLGRIGGVSATAGLFAMTHMNPSDSFESTLVSFIGAFFTGCVLGAVRLATGSLLAAILLHAGVNGLLLAGVLLADVVPIAGWNTPAAHVSGWALAPSAVCVGVGLVWAARAARAEPRALPLPEPEDEDPFFG
ncbi:MAG: CPBP family intramembrane metalloprotease, partial [Proteobacteria bacterium]|nr:CPBP family intramembrane metalloprotease [Pseudomonadota bacterium]